MQPNKSINKILLIGICLIHVVETFAGSSEDPLSQALQTRPLKNIVEGLNTGELRPPEFVQVQKYLPGANKTFELYIQLLTKERSAAISAKYQNPEYPQSLAQSYKFYEKYPSYMSLLLCDTIKRMILEWAQYKIANGGTNLNYEEIFVVTKPTELRSECFDTLRGEKPIVLSKQDTSSKTPFSKSIEQLWESHGYSEVTDGQIGTAQVLQNNMLNMEKQTSILAGEYKPIELALRMIITESLRASSLEGTVAFLKLGGDPSKVQMRDIRYFNSVMPETDRKRYSFTGLGPRRFDAFVLLNFYSIKPVFPSPLPVEAGSVWMRGMLK